MAIAALLSRFQYVNQADCKIALSALAFTVAALWMASGTRFGFFEGPTALLAMPNVICGVAFIVCSMAPRTVVGSIVGCLSLLAVVVLSYPTGYGAVKWLPDGYAGREIYAQATNALQIASNLPLKRAPVFWVDAARYDTFTLPRSYLQCTGYPASFPSLLKRDTGFDSYFPAMTSEYLRLSDTLIIFAPGEKLAEKAAPSLQELGFKAEALGEWKIGTGNLDTTMAVLHISELVRH
jgi:hypothetical protein